MQEGFQRISILNGRIGNALLLWFLLSWYHHSSNAAEFMTAKKFNYFFGIGVGFYSRSCSIAFYARWNKLAIYQLPVLITFVSKKFAPKADRSNFVLYPHVTKYSKLVSKQFTELYLTGEYFILGDIQTWWLCCFCSQTSVLKNIFIALVRF